MTPERAKAKSKAIDEALHPIRAALDQLEKVVDEEGVNVTRQSTEALIEQLTALQILEEEALTTRNSRLIGAVRKERDRCRGLLGLTPRKRRRR